MAVRDAIAATITTLPQALRKSLTWDHGTEMSQHAQLPIATDLADLLLLTRTARGSGRRNENTNGLLRQYFPTCMA